MFQRLLRRRCLLTGLLSAPLMVPMLLYGLLLLLYRPSRTDEDRPLFVGVTYHRRYLSEPRPVLIHLREVDLAEPGLASV